MVSPDGVSTVSDGVSAISDGASAISDGVSTGAVACAVKPQNPKLRRSEAGGDA
jgi:X-X-X-Leu-X-X-Gly heptad repeat protein